MSQCEFLQMGTGFYSRPAGGKFMGGRWFGPEKTEQAAKEFADRMFANLSFYNGSFETTGHASKPSTKN